MMRKLIIITGLMLTMTVAVRAQDWRHQVNENGLRTARVSAPGTAPNGPAATTLTLQCAPGKDGSVSIQYAVSGTDKIKQFNFGDFEGPGAPASKRRLVQFAVQTPRGAVKLQTAVSGYYTDQGVFVFELAAANNAVSGATRVADAIRGGAESVTIMVQDSRNLRRTIQTRFPAADAAPAVTETLKGCDRR